MLKRRAPWWMYLITAIFVLTFFFNARQEAWGPANAGWVPAWPSLRVAEVVAGRPMEKTGLRAGDILEAVDGRQITGMPDWFVARAHFERNRVIRLEVRRGEQHLLLQMTIAAPSWRSWTRTHALGEVVFFIARLILLLLAVFVGFRRPERTRARLAALMFAIGAVAEGYPCSGWAAGLRHLPAVLAVPIGLATTSCLLASLPWLAFFMTFGRSRLPGRWRAALAIVPGVIFGIPIVASVIAMIYAPSVLARPWPQVLSPFTVRLMQDIAGVVPLLFLNVMPAYHPITQIVVLDLWFIVTALYFAAGYLNLASSYRLADTRLARRRVGALCLAVLFFALIVIQNVLARNWGKWFASPRPALLSSPVLIAMDILFLFVPLTLAYYVLTEDGDTPPKSR